jgi:hypothetical protein
MHVRTTTRLQLGVSLAMLALVAGGCFSLAAEDECSIGASRCSHGIAMTCRYDDSDDFFGGSAARWFESSCRQQGHACVTTPSKGAFCALSKEPDPKCGAGDTGYCEGSKVVSCSSGYATYEWRCAAPSLCVQAEAYGAICALDTEPDPRCVGSPYEYQVCDGATLVSCTRRYATREQTCEPACVESEPGHGHCGYPTACSGPECDDAGNAQDAGR